MQCFMRETFLSSKFTGSIGPTISIYILIQIEKSSSTNSKINPMNEKKVEPVTKYSKYIAMIIAKFMAKIQPNAK